MSATVVRQIPNSVGGIEHSGLGRRGENLSILIPTYNCAHYLHETLTSLRVQERRIEQAQIEVLDDCSTRDKPDEVVQSVWNGRVKFYRQPKNVGAIANFNACIERADRDWIHILHGDDFVSPEAYAEFDRCIREFPKALAVFGRSVIGNESSYWTGVSEILGPDARGFLRYDPIEWGINRVNCVGVLLSKQAISRVGGFDDSFCHVADWNLWWRLARDLPVAYTNHCVGFYRMFEGNHSSTLRRKAINILESIEQLERIDDSTNSNMTNLQGFRRSLFIRRYHSGKEQCLGYLDDNEAFRENMRILCQFPSAVKKWYAIPDLWRRYYLKKWSRSFRARAE